MENKTFISTFEKLRFNGYVDDLYSFFDNYEEKLKSEHVIDE